MHVLESLTTDNFFRIINFIKNQKFFILRRRSSKACPQPSIPSNKIRRISWGRKFRFFRRIDIVEIDQITVNVDRTKREETKKREKTLKH